ncbi:long-chain fatty acid--CoA ligase [Zhengella mangrovi]|uniref:Long-chain fatty acid--CoA ligase n=2 Tax=Zhengella mangrovi TaxID=1982044 RepID=A0A2G1QKL0_9HYPH|nr:long-chain fatty acid--CoA ligase [Zhengella mangrovi]
MKPQYKVWPHGLPHKIARPTGTLYENLAATAGRVPGKTAMVFYDTEITFAELHRTVLAIAGWLQQEAGVRPGDRVAIYAQNCPQYVMASYGILRAGGVVVPVNPMNLADEVRHMLEDSGAVALFAARDLLDHALAASDGTAVRTIPVIRYADYLGDGGGLAIPDFLTAAPEEREDPRLQSWADIVGAGLEPAPYDRVTDDLAFLPYTSGSTGRSKGCRHSNATTMHAIRGMYDWFGVTGDDVVLAVAPMFHVVGLQGCMNAPVQYGATTVIVPRWDRDVVSTLIQRHQITAWPAVPTMAIDLIANPKLADYDISSIRLMFGGGIAMPEAVAAKLKELCGVTFLEGYGLTETMAPGTANPPQKPLAQCGGVPGLNTDVRIVDPDTLATLPVGDVGEILISGPQVLLGYWNRPEADAESFVTLDGQRYFRTGDLGRQNDEGYVFIVDRIKRMINASGFKVWPTEVEAILYRHPAVEEACVIASRDPKRGETVKAVVVLRHDAPEVTESEFIDWARGHMAAYKVPRLVSFVDRLPKSGSGKVLWRQLQDEENTAH